MGIIFFLIGAGLGILVGRYAIPNCPSADDHIKTSGGSRGNTGMKEPRKK